MHFDAMAIAVIDGTMHERADVEITAQFAVDAMEHIEVEARGDARGIVIGVVQHALVLLEIDADHHPRAVPQNAAGAAQKGAGFMRLEISERGAREKSDLRHGADGLRQY